MNDNLIEADKAFVRDVWPDAKWYETNVGARKGQICTTQVGTWRLKPLSASFPDEADCWISARRLIEYGSTFDGPAAMPEPEAVDVEK